MGQSPPARQPASPLTRRVGHERGAAAQPQGLKHGHVLVPVVVGRGEQLVPVKDAVCARQEGERLVRQGQVQAARGQAHHGAGHHYPGRGDAADQVGAGGGGVFLQGGSRDAFSSRGLFLLLYAHNHLPIQANK